MMCKLINAQIAAIIADRERKFCMKTLQYMVWLGCIRGLECHALFPK